MPCRPQGSFHAVPAPHPAFAKPRCQPERSTVAGQCSLPLCCQARGGDRGKLQVGDGSAVGCRLGRAVASHR